MTTPPRPPALWCAALLLLLSACQTRIQHGLDERSANELQAVLVERGIEADKRLEPGKKPTWAIEVPDDRATDAVRVLAELGLPRPKQEGFGEVFSAGSLVPTPTEERALYLQALSGELSRTLESIEGVTSARVHLVLPPPPKPGVVATPGKASAYLRVRPGRAEAVAQKRGELRALIAGAVEGLSADAVTLVVDEVVTAVPPSPQVSPARRLRVLVAILGGLVSVLGVALALLAVRLRQRSAEKAAPPPPPPPKPVVATSARRVA